MNAPTQIRIDCNVKKEATKLFKNLGLDMSSAVNIFLRQCILKGGLPFSVEIPQYKKETIEAMEEAIQISKDSSAKTFNSIEELNKELDN